MVQTRMRAASRHTHDCSVLSEMATKRVVMMPTFGLAAFPSHRLGGRTRLVSFRGQPGRPVVALPSIFLPVTISVLTSASKGVAY